MITRRLGAWILGIVRDRSAKLTFGAPSARTSSFKAFWLWGYIKYIIYLCVSMSSISPHVFPPPAASGRCSSAFDPRGPAPLRSCAASGRPRRPARPSAVASAPQPEPRIKGWIFIWGFIWDRSVFIWDLYGIYMGFWYGIVIWDFDMGLLYGIFIWDCYMGFLYGIVIWDFYMGIYMGIYAETVKSWGFTWFYHQNSGEFGFSQLELMISPWIGDLTIRKHQKSWPFHHSRPNEYWKYLKMRYQNLAIKFGCWFSFDFMLISNYDGHSLWRLPCIPVARSVLSGITSSTVTLPLIWCTAIFIAVDAAAMAVIFRGELDPMDAMDWVQWIHDFSAIHQCNESGSKSKRQQVNASSRIRIKVISHKQIKIRVRIKPNSKSESESIQIQSR